MLVRSNSDENSPTAILFDWRFATRSSIFRTETDLKSIIYFIWADKAVKFWSSLLSSIISWVLSKAFLWSATLDSSDFIYISVWNERPVFALKAIRSSSTVCGDDSILMALCILVLLRNWLIDSDLFFSVGLGCSKGTGSISGTMVWGSKLLCHTWLATTSTTLMPCCSQYL